MGPMVSARSDQVDVDVSDDIEVYYEETPRELTVGGRWASPGAAWAEVLDALRAVAAEPSAPSESDDLDIRPARQIIHALWKSRRLTENSAAEALGLSLVVPAWTPDGGVPAENIFFKCQHILDDLCDSSMR